MQNAHVKEYAPGSARSLLEWAGECFAQQGIEESMLNAELLLAHAMHCSRLQVSLQRDRQLTPDEALRFTHMVSRRLTREPLQYILGEAEFMGFTLEVDHRVLIPRPETEILVERALEAIGESGTPGIRILDIGAGSGNIAIALGRRVPSAAIVAVDISAAALQVAERNTRRYSLTNISLLQGDIFDDLLPGVAFHLIVSNPPYVSLEEFLTLQPEVKDFEPRNATTDDADGLSVVRRIAAFARERLLPGGTLLMEIGYNQAIAATEIFASAGLIGIALFDDLAGIPRVITGAVSREGIG